MGEKNNVVSLSGNAITLPGEVRPAVVELAQEVLQRASSGELQGLAVVMYHSDETYSFWKEGAQSHGMVGALETLKIKMIT